MILLGRSGRELLSHHILARRDRGIPELPPSPAAFLAPPGTAVPTSGPARSVHTSALPSSLPRHPTLAVLITQPSWTGQRLEEVVTRCLRFASLSTHQELGKDKGHGEREQDGTTRPFSWQSTLVLFMQDSVTPELPTSVV